MPDALDAAQITRLLNEWQNGSQEAFDRLVPIVYDELRAIAARQLTREWRHNRLQITTVVNEAYLKLFRQQAVDWQNRGHFFAIAAKLMRRILLDHARRHLRKKRHGHEVPVEPEHAVISPADPIDGFEALDLDRALTRLEEIDAGQARIVELRFFGGLTLEETAAALSVSPATIKREWAVARGWLFRELTEGSRSGGPS